MWDAGADLLFVPYRASLRDTDGQVCIRWCILRFVLATVVLVTLAMGAH